MITEIRVVLATLAIVVWYLNRTLFRPLSNLVDTMLVIRQGEPTARLPEQKGDEFAKVQTTFNSMLTELSTLRIRSYRGKYETVDCR